MVIDSGRPASHMLNRRQNSLLRGDQNTCAETRWVKLKDSGDLELQSQRPLDMLYEVGQGPFDAQIL